MGLRGGLTKNFIFFNLEEKCVKVLRITPPFQNLEGNTPLEKQQDMHEPGFDDDRPDLEELELDAAFADLAEDLSTGAISIGEHEIAFKKLKDKENGLVATL
jgi:hypothetical protein